MAPITEYRGGLWFDGTRWVPRTMWVAGPRFSSAPADPARDVVDLDGAHVVPPYGEGHNHWLEADLADSYVQDHLREGIFYVKDQGTPPSVREKVRPLVNVPSSVDYVAAHQGFTGPGGHPMELVDLLAGFGVLPREWASTHGEGDALFAVGSEEEVDRSWARLLLGRPDFVKVFLVHCDEYDARRRDASLSPKARGIDPALVPGIVARAHAAGLKVSAHVENAYDFHVAVHAGVDEIAHMPFVGPEDPAAYRLSDQDVATRPGTIATTLDWALALEPDDPRVAVQRDNLARLRLAGWTIVIGTDRFRETARTEVDLIARLGLMTNAELLRCWSIDTPRSIFPEREIASFAPGAEASFLVLEGDPLADFTQCHRISLRVKQGAVIEPGEARIPPLG